MALSHVVFAGIDPDRVVRDAVEDRVGDGVASKLAVPFLGRQLGGERGAGRVVPEVHELEQESFEWFVGLVDEPFVDGEQVVGCFASMFVRQVRQCFSAVWADGFPRCRHRFPVM